MSTGHWQDAYNQALSILAIERQDSFVDLIQTRIKGLESREGECWYKLDVSSKSTAVVLLTNTVQ